MLAETRPAKVGKWTEPALRVLRERYLARDGGEVVETPEEMCWRGARVSLSPVPPKGTTWARPGAGAPPALSPPPFFQKGGGRLKKRGRGPRGGRGPPPPGPSGSFAPRAPPQLAPTRGTAMKAPS